MQAPLDDALFVSNGDWIMTVSAFFDESGKFGDHKVVSIGSVSSFTRDFNDFTPEWGRLLQLNGLKYFSSKNALNPKRPLSKKNTDTGAEKRIAALLRFVLCIRKHLQVITGVAVDVDEFKGLPNHFFGVFGNDPAYLSFMRLVLKIIEFTGPKDTINLICDDEEKTALPFYSMYRKAKLWLPEARGKMRFISFGDDHFMFGLQAADFVSSIIRYQVTKELKLIDYDYAQLFEVLTQPPERYERLWTVEIAKGDSGTLRGIADEMKHQLDKAKGK